MFTTKLLILLVCTYGALASHHTHNIPIEGYETKLQDLGQHVDIPETPVKIIKITKTIAVKVPVPYPVKVIQKVPYPVHVAKPYPVPVPQIIQVPAARTHKHDPHAAPAAPAPHDSHDAHDYSVQEAPADDYSPAGGHSAPGDAGHSFGDSGSHAFGSSGEGGYGDAGHFGASGGGGGGYEPAAEGQYSGHEGLGQEQSHGAAQHAPNYAAPASNEGSFEFKSYDNALKEYFKNHPTAGHY